MQEKVRFLAFNLCRAQISPDINSFLIREFRSFKMLAPATQKHLVEKLPAIEFPQAQFLREIGFKGLKNSLCRSAAVVFGFYFPRQKLLGESVFAGNYGRKKKPPNTAGFYFAEKGRQNPGQKTLNRPGA